MKYVLFVDDEGKILQGLKRLLRPLRNHWQMHFESDPARAMSLVERQAFDMVVSDMRMPRFTGVDVLRHVRQHAPQAVRIGLSGYADAQLALEAAQVAHQFLAKPCDPDKLVAAVNRVVRLQQRLNSEDLRRSIGSLSSLPSLPALHTQITNEAAAPSGSLETIGEIIAQDVAMTAKVLQLVNSAYFGLSSEVSSAVQATKLLGLETVKALVLTVELFDSMSEGVSPTEAHQLWQHSIATGTLSRQAARLLQLDRGLTDQALLSGMLHDAGKLIEISGLLEAYQEALALAEREEMSRVEAEEQVLGCTHADLGAYLLTLWGFPSAIVEAVAYHHVPGESLDDAPTPLTAVHLANALDGGSDQEALEGRLDRRYLQRVGAEHVLEPLLESHSLRQTEEG